MPVKVDYSDLVKLKSRFQKKASSKQGLTTRKVMRESVKPTLSAMLSFVPVGEAKPGQKYRWGQGGGLKTSIRVMVVKDALYEIKALVGASKFKDKAGWRAHFPDKGPTRGGVHTRRSRIGRFSKTKGKKWTRTWKVTPFSEKSEKLTRELVQNRIALGLEQILEDEFKDAK